MIRSIASAKQFVEGEEGATMIEYALMLALIALVCFAAVTAIGTSASTMFTNLSSTMDSTPAGS